MIIKILNMLENQKNNICIILLSLIMILNSCSSFLNGQTKKNDIYKTIVQEYITYRNSERKIENEKNIILMGANSNDSIEGSYWIELFFVNPELLQDIQYSKVYTIDGYNLIIDESLDKSYLLKNSFKETTYQNFNLAKIPIDYSVTNWNITFNSENEIIKILPLKKTKIIKEILLKKGINFSKEYED